jgi:hypothetical protein
MGRAAEGHAERSLAAVLGGTEAGRLAVLVVDAAVTHGAGADRVTAARAALDRALGVRLVLAAAGEEIFAALLRGNLRGTLEGRVDDRGTGVDHRPAVDVGVVVVVVVTTGEQEQASTGE